MNNTKIWFTCDVCGENSTPQENGRPEGWATAKLEFWNIPRYRTHYEFDICPACILPDTDKKNDINVGTFKKMYDAVVSRITRN